MKKLLDGGHGADTENPAYEDIVCICVLLCVLSVII